MMKQLSSLELHFLLKELKGLKNSRVDKIYNHGKDDLYIQLYKADIGKNLLRIIPGKSIFLAKNKLSDDIPSQFCMLLRKHLDGMFLDFIAQLEPERILKLVFRAKDEIKKLYLEFFGKGNVILCSDGDIIINSLIRHKFKDRSVLPKEKYKNPSMQHNIFELNKNDVADLLKNSNKDKVVTSLAAELGLGGIYAEEVCLLSGINKNTEPKTISNNEIRKIADSIKQLLSRKINAQIIYKNNEAIDAVPIGLEFYKGYEKKKFLGFSKALDSYFAEGHGIKKEKSAYAKKIDEINRIIAEQKNTIENLKNKEKENREKAESIYNNYQLIKEILDEINNAGKEWGDIKEKLKGNKIVKEINLKEKRIVVELKIIQ